MATTDISKTLAERETRYGSFQSFAEISQGIKCAMRKGNWNLLDSDQRECLEMLAHKIARILNGDPNYHDSWHDIVGYAKLVADRLDPVNMVDPNADLGPNLNVVTGRLDSANGLEMHSACGYVAKNEEES